MRIGILQTGRVPDHLLNDYVDYPEMFEQLLLAEDPALTFQNYPVLDNVFPDDIGECDAYLMTGSRAGTYDDYDWIEPAEQILRDIVAAEIPVVGICFGHQLIAQAFGGKSEKSAKGWGQGLHSWEIEQPAWWMDSESELFSLHVSHQDQVVELPPGAVTLASSEFCQYAAFQYGDYAIGIQGHPEIAREYSQEIMNMRREMIGEDVYCDGVASLASDHDAPVVARWMLRFMRGPQRG